MRVRLGLLREQIRAILTESPASNAFEKHVASAVKAALSGTGAKIEHAGSSEYSDIRIDIPGIGSSFLEVKLTSGDNLGNPRLQYDGNQWIVAGDSGSPLAAYAVEFMNESPEAQAFINDLKAFLKTDTVRLQGKKPGSVTLPQIKAFLAKRPNKNIAELDSVDAAALATQHYAVAKKEPAHYVQAGDDFYLMGSADPLDLNLVNDGQIPVLRGMGRLAVRIADRSARYEVQVSVKMWKHDPSPFSAMLPTSKVNPFTALAKSLKARKRG